MTGGERFNTSMTNEERRSESNLMLMCGKHHTYTNNVDKYPVDVMRTMKLEHESPYRLGFNTMLMQEIRDRSAADVLVLPTSCAASLEYFGAGHDANTVEQELQYWQAFGEKLERLTRDARMLLAIAATYAYTQFGSLGLTIPELARRTEESPTRIADLVQELAQADAAHADYDPSFYEHQSEMFIVSRSYEEPLTTLKEFALGTQVEMIDIVGNLRFDLLD